MTQIRENETPSQVGKVVDFDAAMLDACAPEIRADLLREARLLAGAFAPLGGPDELMRMAAELSAGSRDSDMDRAHARALAAALKRLARDGLAADA